MVIPQPLHGHNTYGLKGCMVKEYADEMSLLRFT
jgi:hypothetical protein